MLHSVFCQQFCKDISKLNWTKICVSLPFLKYMMIYFKDFELLGHFCKLENIVLPAMKFYIQTYSLLTLGLP